MSYVKYEDELDEKKPDTISEDEEDRYIIVNSKEKPKHRRQRSCIYKQIIENESEGVVRDMPKPEVHEIGHKDTEMKPFAREHPEGPLCPLLEKYFPNYLHPEEQKAGTSKLIQKGDNFEEIEDDFFTIFHCNVGHLQENCTLPPTVYQNSEYLDLLWARKNDNVGRLQITTLLLSSVQSFMDDHLVLDHDFFEFARTQCYKLEPLEEGSYISVDGEAAQNLPTYVELHKQLANVIVL